MYPPVPIVPTPLLRPVSFLLSGYSVSCFQYGEMSVDAMSDGESADGSTGQYWRRLCAILVERSVDVMRQWAGSVPGFSDLVSHDQQLLFGSALLEVFTLRLADRSASNNCRMTNYELPR